MKHVWLWGAVGIALLGLSFSVLELSGRDKALAEALADEIIRLRDRGFRRDIRIAELEADLKDYKERVKALPLAYRLILGSVREGPYSDNGQQAKAIRAYTKKHGVIKDPCLVKLFADVGRAIGAARKTGLPITSEQAEGFLLQAEECL